MHYTKEEIVKHDFLFVSYDHRHSEAVTDVINELIGQGVRLWYDADLGVGNEWSVIAEGLIKHENCRGVVFFNTHDSLKSEAVHDERRFTLEKQAACAEANTPFVIFPVNMGAPSTMRLLREVFAGLPENDAEAERTFPLEYVQVIASLFKRELIYCYADPNDREGYIRSLYRDIAKAIPAVIDKDTLRMKELETAGTGAKSTTVTLGAWKNQPADTLPASLLKGNQVVTFQGTPYIVCDGQAYTAKRLGWRPLYCADDRFVLLSETVVDVRYGGKELQEWLSTVFGALAFTAEEREALGQPRLLTEEDLSKTENRALFDFSSDPAAEPHWWIDAMARGIVQKVIKKDGSVFSSGYNCRTKKSGVRPVIVIHRETLARLTGSQ